LTQPRNYSIKLIYPNGTIVEVVNPPYDFTGIIQYSKSHYYYKEGAIEYFVNGVVHRDNGLPAILWGNGNKSYYVNGDRTGFFIAI
jgi:hypothetical protein